MKQSSKAVHDEPVGIVISGGNVRSDSTPRFSAYVWAPAPEEELPPGVQAA
jgi:hypothetical protein